MVEGEYVWPKDTPKKQKKHPLLGGLQDIDEFSMEYPSPIKVNSDLINQKLEDLEALFEKKLNKPKDETPKKEEPVEPDQNLEEEA